MANQWKIESDSIQERVNELYPRLCFDEQSRSPFEDRNHIKLSALSIAFDQEHSLHAELKEFFNKALGTFRNLLDSSLNPDSIIVASGTSSPLILPLLDYPIETMLDVIHANDDMWMGNYKQQAPIVLLQNPGMNKQLYQKSINGQDREENLLTIQQILGGIELIADRKFGSIVFVDDHIGIGMKFKNIIHRMDLLQVPVKTIGFCGTYLQPVLGLYMKNLSRCLSASRRNTNLMFEHEAISAFHTSIAALSALIKDCD